MDGNSGHVDIAFAGVSTHKLIGALSRETRRMHPGITTTFHSQSFAQGALDRVLQGDVDIALGRWDFMPVEVESEVLVSEKLELVVSENHPLAGSTSVAFEQLTAEPFIELMDTSSVLHDRLQRLAHAALFEPEVVQLALDTWTALALVGAEIGLMLTLDSVKRNVQDDHIRFIPVDDETKPIQLRMAWLGNNPNPALSRILDVARGVVADDQDPETKMSGAPAKSGTS